MKVSAAIGSWEGDGRRAPPPRRHDRVNRGAAQCTLGVVGRGIVGVVVKVRFLAVMAAAEAGVGGSCHSGRLGGLSVPLEGPQQPPGCQEPVSCVLGRWESGLTG